MHAGIEHGAVLSHADLRQPAITSHAVPIRVHPILARKANTAVVIRRGPSKSVCTMLWDRRNDTFKLGQRLCGRIYERRCDLSPDGKHFIYFAMNGNWAGPMKGSWTAISRTPYRNESPSRR